MRRYRECSNFRDWDRRGIKISSNLSLAYLRFPCKSQVEAPLVSQKETRLLGPALSTVLVSLPRQAENRVPHNEIHALRTGCVNTHTRVGFSRV